MEQNVRYYCILELANHLCLSHTICIVNHFKHLFHFLPKFASKTKRIQVGNGQFVSVLFIIPIIVDIHGHRFELYMLVS